MYLWTIVSFLKSMDGYYMLLFAGFGVYFLRFLYVKFFHVIYIEFYLYIISFWKYQFLIAPFFL